MTPRSVLVTDGEQRAALALVRSLGRAGHRVFACASRRHSIAGASRYCRRAARVADPLIDPESFLSDVARLVREWGIDVLIPVSEASLLSILPARTRLGGVEIPFPDIEHFRRISDKEQVLGVAPRFGIGVPQQWVLPRPGVLPEEIARELRFPVVLKPSRSIGEDRGRRVKLDVRYAADRAQLAAQLAEMDAAAYPLLLQRRVSGAGIGVFLLLWDGETLAAFSHRRIREKPPSGGVSVYRESIPADPSLVARSRALLEHFEWRGVAMVEYKVDETSGIPYLMEINGRFWGSLQLAVDAGVDFPVLLLSAMAGGRPSPVTRYRIGVRSRWWWGDVDHLIARLRPSPRGADGAPGRWRAIRDFLALWRPGDRNEILRVDDPRPFVRETIEWLAGR